MTVEEHIFLMRMIACFIVGLIIGVVLYHVLGAMI